MKRIQKFVNCIDAEVEDAKGYALDYLDAKADGNVNDANRYREMANDEIKHTNYLHDMAVTDINKLKANYTAPAEMEDAWNHAHREYLEEIAMVKQLLSM